MLRPLITFCFVFKKCIFSIPSKMLKKNGSKYANTSYCIEKIEKLFHLEVKIKKESLWLNFHRKTRYINLKICYCLCLSLQRKHLLPFTFFLSTTSDLIKLLVMITQLLIFLEVSSPAAEKQLLESAFTIQIIFDHQYTMYLLHALPSS